MLISGNCFTSCYVVHKARARKKQKKRYYWRWRCKVNVIVYEWIHIYMLFIFFLYYSISVSIQFKHCAHMWIPKRENHSTSWRTLVVKLVLLCSFSSQTQLQMSESKREWTTEGKNYQENSFLYFHSPEKRKSYSSCAFGVWHRCEAKSFWILKTSKW